MTSENENWLIKTGDVIITKMSESGLSFVADAEKAVYCFWVIDYSVRNSGSLGAMEDIYPNALLELNQFAIRNACVQLSLIAALSMMNNEEKFCDNFYQFFESACSEIRTLYQGS